MVEAKMERAETSTSDIGPEFSIDFRQELAKVELVGVYRQQRRAQSGPTPER